MKLYLQKYFREVDWSVVTQTDTETGFENFLILRNNLIDKYVPLEKLKNTKKNSHRYLG